MALTGQSALARASYVASARAKALTPPNHHFQHLEVAAFCAATWLVFPPPLTLKIGKTALYAALQDAPACKSGEVALIEGAR